MAEPKPKEGDNDRMVRRSVSLPASDYAEVVRIAEQKHVSESWVIREAVRDYLRSKTPLFGAEN